MNLSATLERVWCLPQAQCKSRAGRKPVDAVLTFKTLVLSALYNLSDDHIEYQMCELQDQVPDAKELCGILGDAA